MVVYTLYRLPQIVSLGFIDAVSAEEVISIEHQEEEDGDAYLNYKVEEEIDIVQFVKEVAIFT